MSALYVDAGFLKAEINSLLTAHPELAEDDILREDMLAGETDLEKVVAKALNERREAETIASAIKERESALASRRARFEKKADAMKKLIKGILQSANLDKLTLPEATLSIQSPRTSVDVINIDDLPQGTFKTVKQPDRAALKRLLEGGEEIPGARLALGDETLVIRVR